MKALLLLLALVVPVFGYADVSIPRAKQYAWSVYDTAVLGGQSVAHPLGLTLPAGAIITDMWVYINTQFASSGTESLAFQCAGTRDLMAYNSVKNIAKDRVLTAQQALIAMNGGSATSFIGTTASGEAVNLSQGFGSIPTACGVSAVVRGDSGYTPYTAGKATLIIEYFKL